MRQRSLFSNEKNTVEGKHIAFVSFVYNYYRIVHSSATTCAFTENSRGFAIDSYLPYESVTLEVDLTC